MAAAAGAQTVEYLREHGVPDIIDAAVRSLMESKSMDPIKYFADYFQKEMAARYEGLTIGATGEIYGMAINKDLNGMKGKITGKQDEALVSFAGFGVIPVKVGELKPASGCVTAVGDEVEGVSVSGQAELNGKKGVVKAFRTKVTVEVGGKTIAVPQESVKLVASIEGDAEDDLEKGREVEVQKMLIDTSLNGKRGKVVMGVHTCVVKIDGEDGIQDIALANVKAVKEGEGVKKGSDIIIRNMLIKKELNDKKGHVKQITSKYYVNFGTEKKLLPRAALKKV